jgi:hypothetical protein
MILGTCFKNFKGTLYREFVFNNKETNWDEEPYTTQKDFYRRPSRSTGIQMSTCK